MRRNAGHWIMAVGLALGLMASTPARVYADTVLDKLGDWVATAGKSDLDKEAVRAKRRTQREAARAERAARTQAKKTGRDLDKAGKKMKKATGLN